MFLSAHLQKPRPVNFLYNAHMEKEITITKIAYGGEGIGSVDGKICFVDNALPGETVLARIVEEKPKFMRARTARILAASPHRTVPECRYYGACGGCQYQHLSYEEELRWKETQVREHLSRNLKIDPALIRPIAGCAKPYGYRGSVTLHEARGRAGFFGVDNKTLVEIETCLLAADPLMEVFKRKPGGKDADTAYRVSSEGKVFSSAQDSFFDIRVGNKTITTHSKSFFQNNLEATEKLADKIKEKAAQISPAMFIDLYAGAGTFTLLSAPANASLVIAEESPWGLQALEKNLQRWNLTAEVLKGKVERIFPEWLKKHNPQKAMLLVDPPRTGMDSRLAEKIAAHPGIENLAYVSCHLGTLTRDLGIILKNGRLKIREVYPFDMFPRTKHIEILVLLA